NSSALRSAASEMAPCDVKRGSDMGGSAGAAARLPSSDIVPSYGSYRPCPNGTLAWHKRAAYPTKAQHARSQAWLAAPFPKAAWAAASRAIGTRNGEQET